MVETLEDQDPPAGAGQVCGSREPVVAGADHDVVVDGAIGHRPILPRRRGLRLVANYARTMAQLRLAMAQVNPVVGDLPGTRG